MLWRAARIARHQKSSRICVFACIFSFWWWKRGYIDKTFSWAFRVGALPSFLALERSIVPSWKLSTARNSSTRSICWHRPGIRHIVHCVFRSELCAPTCILCPLTSPSTEYSWPSWRQGTGSSELEFPREGRRVKLGTLVGDGVTFFLLPEVPG